MNKLIESVAWESGTTTEAGVLRDVKILGQKSKNKRHYTEQAMESAVALYEGKTVYISHAQKGVVHRPAHERYGRLTGVRYDRTRKQLRGDLVYLESQAQMTAMLKEDLDRNLNFFGLSHVADGDYHRDAEGNQIVTNITRVESVDLVSDPATATSLREQEDGPAPGTPAPNPADAALADAFSQAVLAVLQDSTLDVPAKAAKIETILTQHADLTKPADDKGDKPADDKAPAAEQKAADPVAKLTEQVAALTATVAALKPKKYVAGATPTVAKLIEQTAAATAVDAPPKDKAALRKWMLAK